MIHGFIVGLLVGLGPEYEVRSERGASPCLQMAAVFDGKRAWVARAGD